MTNQENKPWQVAIIVLCIGTAFATYNLGPKATIVDEQVHRPAIVQPVKLLAIDLPAEYHELLEPVIVAEPDPTRQQFFAAVSMVESSSKPGENTSIVGDNGRSLGPFQISHAYWTDANMPGHWTECSRWDYSAEVMARYFRRYCLVAWNTGDWQTLARIHNGGPRGHRKAATVGYWAKVKAEMEKGQK